MWCSVPLPPSQDEDEDSFANHIHSPHEGVFRRRRQSRENDASASCDAEGGGGGGRGVDITRRPIPDELPTGLVFVCCDDDPMPRMFAEVLISSAAADEDESVILGETFTDVMGLPDRLCELAGRVGHDKVVAILDQNLDQYDEGHFTGCEICRVLRQRDFRGVIVIQSANDEKDDELLYMQAGADAAIGKAVHGGPAAILGVIARAWHGRNS